jgi:L-ascorbate metabolism protein UlaG (beta-lactamase superfamily)
MKAEYEGVAFTRPGHATVRIESNDGLVFYLDPWSHVIENAPHDADFVFVTHDDYDHYDPDAIRAVSSDRTVVVAYEEIDTSGLEQDVRSLPYNGMATVNDIEIQTVPAYNRPDGKHVRESGEPYHPEGEGIGLIFAIDGLNIYFAGDTDFLDDHRSIDADILIPPIGGRPTMDRHEAGAMIKSIKPDLVLPVHYDTEAIGGIETDAEAFKEEVESGGAKVVLF